MKEERQPGRMAEPVRALAVSIPFLAVDEVDPGSGLAVAFLPELVRRQRHSNDINTFDSLQDMVYPGNEYRPQRSLRARRRFLR
jgi:hypothetical protein